LRLNDQQLENPAGGEDQPDGADDEGEPQGNSDEEAQEGDGVQDDQREKEEAAELRKLLTSPLVLLARGHLALI
jgi:hypothetical protein